MAKHAACDCNFWTHHEIRAMLGFPCRRPLATIHVEEKHIREAIHRSLMDDFARRVTVHNGQITGLNREDY